MVFKWLFLNPLNVFIMCTLNYILVDNHTGPRKYLLYFHIKVVKFNLNRNKYIVVPTICGLLKQNFLNSSIKKTFNVFISIF